MLEYLAGAEVIIHNAGFDVGFLNEELKRVGRSRFGEIVTQVTDSLTMAREMFPGKSNSLDALCKRLEVDNTNRALHGALLDAGLLAEVYIRMTRGQNSLVIDGSEGSTREAELAIVDFSAFDLLVIAANEAEASAHDMLLAELDKACGGRTIWRTLVA